MNRLYTLLSGWNPALEVYWVEYQYEYGRGILDTYNIPITKRNLKNNRELVY